MVSILKHKSILNMFPRLTNKFCKGRTNDVLPTLSPLVYVLWIAKPHLAYNIVFIRLFTIFLFYMPCSAEFCLTL